MSLCHHCLMCARKHVGNISRVLCRHRQFGSSCCNGEAGHIPQLLPGGAQVCPQSSVQLPAGAKPLPKAPVHAGKSNLLQQQQQPRLLRSVTGRRRPSALCQTVHLFQPCAAVVGQLRSEGHRWVSGPGPAHSRLDPNPS